MSRQNSVYLSICTTLEEDIRAGKFQYCHRLSGENRLARHFGVSRMTVRQALAELARKQLMFFTVYADYVALMYEWNSLDEAATLMDRILQVQHQGAYWRGYST